ncbi:GNAT family N-acetyltransferase [Cumulibacter manganitolerans]|uniref:GNAT family N-acetyltransferase n=1 Tax=Cumulibacter manganitolerans TaxID=1884992 RepID=UPI001885C3CF|nr:GNAT family protein [Cumulibacter manganitolerans]
MTLRHGAVTIRPLAYGDRSAWRAVRLRNREWLRPWEPTSAESWEARSSRLAFLRMRRDSGIAAHERRLLPFAILHGSAFVGQVNLGPIQWGPVRSADVGYWVDRQRAGQGITPIAVALAIQHAFDIGLHRVHAAIAPENAASIRVAEKLGMRLEGRYVRYLDINGSWRDHLGYALTADDDLTALRGLLET